MDALGGARDVTNDRRPRCGSISPFQGGDRLVVLLVRELYVPLPAADFKEEAATLNQSDLIMLVRIGRPAAS